MNEENPKHDPAGPGPFQKYLFSGACYVQIGQCYGLVHNAVSKGLDGQSEQELLQQLGGIWRDYMLQQNSTIAAMIPPGHADSHKNPWGDTGKLHDQVMQAGSAATVDFVRRLQAEDPDRFGLDAFFSSWATACDRAYADLVKSEAFARALAEVVNTTFRALTRGEGVIPDNE